MLIVAVPGVRVIPVVVPRFQAVAPDPRMFQVPLPKFNALVFELALLKSPDVMLYPLRFNVPFVKVTLSVTVVIDMLLFNCQVPPTPSKVMGKSVVTPLVLIVLIPEVAANVVALPLLAHVVVGDSVRLPYIVLTVEVSVPENPVRFKSLSLWEVVILIVSLPAVTLKENAFASDIPLPGDIVLVVPEELFVRLTTGVPVTVNPVTVVVSHKVVEIPIMLI